MRVLEVPPSIDNYTSSVYECIYSVPSNVTWVEIIHYI